MAAAGKKRDACGDHEECFYERQREVALARASEERLIFLLVLAEGVTSVEMARKLHFGKLTRAALDRICE